MAAPPDQRVEITQTPSSSSIISLQSLLLPIGSPAPFLAEFFNGILEFRNAVAVYGRL
jgi:hypothetical protein